MYPPNPSPKRLAAGAVLHSKNVSTEINTVFENVVELLKLVDPLKLNAVLTAVAEGVRGQGQRMGQATTDLNEVLLALNARAETIGANWRSLKNFTDTYDVAAHDIVSILDAVSTTSTTVTDHAAALDGLLLNAIGLSTAGTNLLATSKDDLAEAVNTLEPTTNLLLQHSPVYTCFLKGTTWYLDNGGYAAWGGDGRTLQLDVALLLGNDPYAYPNNLPIVAAKGGPGGAPGCGSLPDATKNFPVRQLITNTGWGTGLDIRPNPGHRASLLGELLPGDPRCTGATQHSPVPSGPGDRAGSLPRGAAVWRAAVRAGRSAVMAGGASGGPGTGPGAARPQRAGPTVIIPVVRTIVV